MGGPQEQKDYNSLFDDSLFDEFEYMLAWDPSQDNANSGPARPSEDEGIRSEIQGDEHREPLSRDINAGGNQPAFPPQGTMQGTSPQDSPQDHPTINDQLIDPLPSTLQAYNHQGSSEENHTSNNPSIISPTPAMENQHMMDSASSNDHGNADTPQEAPDLVSGVRSRDAAHDSPHTPLRRVDNTTSGSTDQHRTINHYPTTPQTPTPAGPAAITTAPLPAPSAPAPGAGGPGGPFNLTSFEVLQRQQEFSEVKLRAVDASSHLATLPAMRKPELRPRKRHPPLVDRPRNHPPLLAQIAGTEVEEGKECNQCSDNNGHYNKCVVVPGYFLGSCANCRFNDRARFCSFHANYGQATPKPKDLIEQTRQFKAEHGVPEEMPPRGAAPVGSPLSAQRSHAGVSAAQLAATPTQARQGEWEPQQPATPVPARVAALTPGRAPRSPLRGTKRSPGTAFPYHEGMSEEQRQPTSPFTNLRGPPPPPPPAAFTPVQNHFGSGWGGSYGEGEGLGAYQRGPDFIRRDANFAPWGAEDPTAPRPPPRSAFIPAQNQYGVGWGSNYGQGEDLNAYQRGLDFMRRDGNFAPWGAEGQTAPQPPPHNATPNSAHPPAPAPAGPGASNEAALPRSNRGNKIEIKNEMKRRRQDND